MAPAPHRRRRRLFRLLTLALLLVGLVGLDRGLRWLWYLPTYSELHALLVDDVDDLNKDFLRFKPDWLLEWKFHPDTTIKVEAYNYYTGKRLPYRIASNNLGFRGADVERHKAPGTLRLVAMGGSSTMGPGVPVERAYAHLLGGLLRPRLGGRKLEVINAGVDAYASRHGFRQYYRDIRPLKPDLLIVAYDVNDVYEPASAERARSWRRPAELERIPPDEPWMLLRERQRGRGALDGLRSVVYESGLFYTLAYASRWVGKHFSDSPPREPEPERPHGLMRCKQPHLLAAIAKPWDVRVTAYRYHLLELDKLAREDGVPVLYLSVPVSDPDLGDINTPLPFSKIMAALARDRPDRRHVQPLASFCRHPIGQVMIDEVHPSAQGHRLLARALMQPALKLLKR